MTLTSLVPRRAQHVSMALALCLALSLLMTFPLVMHLADAVPGFVGDNVFFIWEIWWVKRALVDLQTSPFFSTNVYYPIGYELARDELSPANTFLALPLTILAGPLLAYNVLMLLSFVLSAFGAYVWALRLSGSRRAALLSGIVFAFVPYRFAHYFGHLNLDATQWMPLALAAMDTLFVRANAQRVIVVGIFVALIFLSAWYYALFAVLIIPLYTLLRWQTSGRRWADAQLWKSLLCALLVILVLVLPFALPTVQVAASNNFARTLAEKEMWALNPYDYLVPSLLNPWWHDWVAQSFPHQSKLWIELGISLSLVALALAVLAWGARRSRYVTPVLITLLVAYLISLGPTLHWADQQVRLPLPAMLDATLAPLWSALPVDDLSVLKSSGTVAIPLPSLAIHYWLPFGAGVRSMDRMAIWAALMISGLASVGFVTLRTRLPRKWGMAAWACIVVLICIESYSSVPLTPLHPRAVDAWLAAQPANTVVLEYPWYGHILDYYGTVHQQPVVFGVDGASYLPAWLRQRSALVADIPSDASLRALKEWRVSLVVFSPQRFSNWTVLKAKLDAAAQLKLEQVLDDVWVYRVVDD